MTGRPRVGISRCLLGDAVRYDGRHKYEPTVVETLGAAVEWVPVCPELEAGMGVPREPVELIRSPLDGRVRMVGAATGTDWTDRMHAWVRERLVALQALQLSGFVLKSRSPSCGIRDVPVRGAGAQAGVFAAALVAAMPDLPIEDEERLRDSARRAEFLAAVRTHHSRP